MLQDDTSFDGTAHLTPADVAVNSHQNPTLLAVRIKKSKTDQFSQGTTIYIGKTSSTLCPVAAMLHYLSIRPAESGPLFVTKDGQHMTKNKFMKMIRNTLAKAGIDSSGYKGHSFCIGAATTAAANGINECLIKALGRWSSSAYQTYIKIPPHELAAVAPVLSTP